MPEWKVEFETGGKGLERKTHRKLKMNSVRGVEEHKED